MQQVYIVYVIKSGHADLDESVVFSNLREAQKYAETVDGDIKAMEVFRKAEDVQPKENEC